MVITRHRKSRAIDAEEATALEKAREEGDLVICDVVAAELFAYWQDEIAYDTFLTRLGATFLALNHEAEREAGRNFAVYRQSGGLCEYLIPDFLVAAHALLQSDQLAALDRGYLRAYFPKLKMLKA